MEGLIQVKPPSNSKRPIRETLRQMIGKHPLDEERSSEHKQEGSKE